MLEEEEVMMRRDAFTHCGRWCSAAACPCTLNHACRSHAFWGKDKGLKFGFKERQREGATRMKHPQVHIYTETNPLKPVSEWRNVFVIFAWLKEASSHGIVRHRQLFIPLNRSVAAALLSWKPSGFHRTLLFFYICLHRSIKPMPNKNYCQQKRLEKQLIR